LKNRASTVEGLLQNYETIGEVIKAAEGAEGSALKENERYLESIEGRIEVLQNRLQEFWYNLLDSEMVKEFVDMGTKLIDVLDNVLSGLTNSGILNLVTGALSGIVDLLDIITSSLGEISTWLTAIGGVKLWKKFNGKDSGGRVKVIRKSIINVNPRIICHRIV
jgi:hypothetical protein